MKKERIEYIDLLRIISIVSMITIHVAAVNWRKVGVESFEWNVLNIWDSISRWCVPIFVMISGVLFLSREVTIKKIYTKYIPRIAMAFFFWSFIYVAIQYPEDKDINKLINQFFVGHYHMWFLFMIIGLYMLVPILKKIVESEKLTKYFLLLAFIFSYLIPQAQTILELYNKKTMVNILNSNMSNLNIFFRIYRLFCIRILLA